MLKAGVIGVGYMGSHHARIYSTLNNIVKLQGVFDIDQSKSELVSKNLNVKNYQNMNELIHDCDVISIATPTDKHHEIAISCIKKGKHVLIEKPIAETLEKAEEIKYYAQKYGVKVMVGHTERFNPVIRQLSNYVVNPIFIECRRMGPLPSRKSSTGVLLDLMIHDIDIIVNHLMKGNKIKSISSMGNSVYTFTNNEDIAVGNIIFDNGSIAVMTASRCYPSKERKMRIVQPDNSIYVDMILQYMEIHHVPSNIYKHADKESFEVKIEIPNIIRSESLRMEIIEFLDSVIKNREPLVSIDDGINSLRIATQMLKNMQIAMI
ncbi:MAG: Gfo/Idh/MocA family oxidoreductase [Candidatus Calescibacterium sp.]|nr:Gfo/Idh/MocA family oxidoreductase [Candidatus Calescibacterium sp.]MCX7972133.1 Gfo/Idh/MocA family oxidoreductase [bacterium]MDW8194821.1 Gfo/Idh/MocA family oxidoreductase [Candidatus Calescibacterium sp.]